jgi:O-antigen/teichoic acid export membrane protein
LGGGTLLDYALRGGQLLVLAAVLSPRDFGLVATGQLLLAALAQLTEFRLDDALVHWTDGPPSDEVLDTAFTLSVCRGLVLAAASYLAAPMFCDRMGSPEAVGFLRVLSCTFLIDALRSRGVPLLTRRLDFSPTVRLTTLGSVASSVVTIALAATLRNPWVLVFDAVLRSVAGVVSSHIAAPVPLRLRISGPHLRRLWGYVSHLLLGGVLGWFQAQTDRWAVALMLGVESLGQYTVALGLVNSMAVPLRSTLHGVAFPSLASKRDRHEAFMNTVTRFATASAGIALTAIVAAWTVLPLCVGVLQPARWAAVAQLVPIVAILIAPSLLLAAGPNAIFKAVGILWPLNVSQLVEATAFVGLTLLLVGRLGVSGAGVALLMMYGIALAVRVLLLALLLPESGRAFLAGVWTALPSAAMAVAFLAGLQGLGCGKFVLAVAGPSLSAIVLLGSVVPALKSVAREEGSH